MKDGASSIVNARDLIDRYYGEHLGRDLPSSFLQSELEYAEYLLRRYTAGPEFLDHAISKIVSGYADKGSLARFTDIKGPMRVKTPALQREWNSNRRYQNARTEEFVGDVSKSYKIAVAEFASIAIAAGKVPEIILRDMKAKAEAAVQDLQPKDVPAIADTGLATSLQRILQSANERMVEERVYRSVAQHLGFQSESDFVDEKLSKMGMKRPPPAKSIATEASQKKVSNTGSKSITKNTDMAASSIMQKSERATQKIAAEVVVTGYQYDPRSRKNFILITSSALPKRPQPYKLLLSRSSASFNATKAFQSDIFDQRFVDNNPVGTKMIATLKHLEGNTFSTEYMRKSKHDVSHGNFTLIQVDQRDREYGNLKKRHVAMRWAQKGVSSDQIYVLQDRFARPQRNLLKTDGAWWGFQVRAIVNKTVAGLSRVNVWNSSQESSPTFSELENLVGKYRRAYASNPNVRIEVTLCECVKVIPTIKPFPDVAKMMLDTPTLLEPGVFTQTQLGGQVMTRGLIEYQQNDQWGLSVVSGGSFLDMPLPNKDSTFNHIQQHIRDSEGNKLNLNKDIALSANGVAKQKMQVNEVVTAPPKPVQAQLNIMGNS